MRNTTASAPPLAAQLALKGINRPSELGLGKNRGTVTRCDIDLGLDGVLKLSHRLQGFQFLQAVAVAFLSSRLCR